MVTSPLCRHRHPLDHHHQHPRQKSLKSTVCSNSGSSLYGVSKVTSDAVLGHPLLTISIMSMARRSLLTLLRLMPLLLRTRLRPPMAAPAPDEDESGLVVGKLLCAAGNIFCKPKNGYRRLRRAAEDGGKTEDQNRVDGRLVQMQRARL
jgi:hypothetical protein